METIRLGPTQSVTTRVGFGCAHLIGTMSWRESSGILDAAYDAGVRHFDVAAMYGFGDAERCLGAFVRRRGGDVTITTKFGIPGGKRRRLFRLARSLAKPVLRRLRGNAAPPPPARTSTPASVSLPPPDPSRFAVDRAAASLEASLSALRTDHIHVLLMHEASAAELLDDRLLRFLEDAVRAGKIGTFGVGSDRPKVPDLLAQRREYCRVTQYQWCAADPEIGPTPWFRIHHGAFGDPLRQLQVQLRGDPQMCAAWSAQVGRDLADPAQVARLIMRAPLVMNRDSIVLFATRRPEHVHVNCAAAEDASLEGPTRRFVELVRNQLRREGSPSELSNVVA